MTVDPIADEYPLQCQNCLRIDQPTELVEVAGTSRRLCVVHDDQVSTLRGIGCAPAIRAGMLGLFALYNTKRRPEPGTPYPTPDHRGARVMDRHSGKLYSCERLNLGIVNQHMRDAWDVAFEAGEVNMDCVSLCGRAATIAMLLDLVQDTGLFLPETDPERRAEGWRGHYRGSPVRQVRPEWNPAMRLDELWIITEGNPRVTIIRDDGILDGKTVKL